MKFATFINNLSTKYGLNLTNEPGYVDLLSANLEVPDNVAAAFDGVNLFNEASAKNSTELKNYFMAQALNGVDVYIESALNEREFSDEERAEVKGIKNTYDKLKVFANRIEALKEKKAAATTTGEKSNLQQQINALNAEKAALVDDKKREIDAMKREHNKELLDMIVESKIATAQLDTTKFPKDVATTIARTMLDKALAEKGAKLVNDSRSIKLKRAEDEALDYYENNTAVTFDAFVDRVLADNKLIAVNEPTPAPVNTGFQQNNRTTPPVPGGGPRPAASSSYLNAIDQALADLNRGQAGVV